jgi:hypothetical protein
LERIGRFLWITERPNRDCPEPVPVPLEESAKGIRIAVNMATQQILVGRALVGQGSIRQSLIAWPTRLRQGVAVRRLLVRFRRFLPPPW